LVGDIFSAPDFVPAIVAADEDLGKFLNDEGVTAQLAEFRLDVFLHDANGGHDRNDGENTDQDTDERQCRAQFVGRQRLHGHEETLGQFGTEESGTMGAR